MAVMGNNPSLFKAPTNPVEKVSWDDIQPFLAKLNAAGIRRILSAKIASAVTEMKFALPTEAQWEYACRAGTTTTFCFGDDPAVLGDYAWYIRNSGNKTHQVGQRKPNAWGLYDMHGNVVEWCADRYAWRYYAQSPPTDPVGPSSGSARMARSSSYGSRSGFCRSMFRDGNPPDWGRSPLGFRLALVPVDQ